MEGFCGANCNNCELLKIGKCKGCKITNGCPFGKKCWIAKYIEIGEKESFEEFKKELINEVNSLNIDDMPKIDELYPLHGLFVNLEYTLPNNNKVKFLFDDENYLGNQVESKFSDDKLKKYFGIIANKNFILISKYEENGKNSQIICYIKR